MELEGDVDFYRMEKSYKENLEKSEYQSYQMETKDISKYFNNGGNNYLDEDDIEEKFSD